ncbi:hypothetical protein [Arthrobacter sp. SLBN-122]|uniref:hypothetical protein n=1 Tax=Arthrobacter sp. SLBN-122 TaxID=2768455 RepID=UPI00114F61EC|nr:hypothetical protein [Arthrobacter sp. SLBN-122]TQJ35147.1 hypothetical protein FBY36_2400 [Arthrobacter sp. SLBN-122]
MTSASDNLVTLVDDMLQDAGLGRDAELRDALVTLGTLASLPAPAPTGELAVLIAAGSAPKEAASDGRSAEEPGDAPSEDQPDHDDSADDQPSDDRPDDELARRRRRHRPTALGLVLVAGMGLGVGGVAASTTAPGNSAIGHLLEDWTPWVNPDAGPPAAAPGNPAAEVDAHADVIATASTPAPGGAALPGRSAFRLLHGHAGLAGYTGPPACLGPVVHDAGMGSGKCLAGPAWAAELAGTGGSKDGGGAAATAGTPSGPAADASGKDGVPAPDAAAGGAEPAGEAPAGAARNAAGSAGAGDTVPGKGQGASQGNNQKPAPPAK